MISNLNKIRNFFIVLFIPFLFNSPASAFVSQDKELPKYVDSKDERFNKLFREGRDLIDKEEWAKAAEKFNQIVCDCPENQYVDAAFYWLAFCYKKQKMFGEMNATLDRLLKFFPNSSWSDDARVMKYESFPVTLTTASSPRPSSNGFSVVAGIAPTSASDLQAATILAASPQTPLDREDEIKLAAFQSLLAANQQRGIEILDDILKNGSKASETLKREVLRSLRTPKLGSLGDSYVFSTNTDSTAKFDAQMLSQLREILAKSYENESNVKIRTEIIYALSNLNDAESTSYIIRLYSSERDKELKKAIINSFGGTNFYTFSASTNLSSSRKQNFDKLLEILKTENDSELRRLALSNLQRFPTWSTNGGMVETLSQIYDSENDEAFKLSIIRSFAVSKQNQAMKKLLDIAKNDKSDKLRLEAIRSLRTSNNPEVVKFLEDLIK
ncbi:MAG: HEAT repeat domain-containing protein [Pyrinomonadaceae bacterium]|nr:HEAT repeat domain-containing protein [Pyrinomonadaceae bacterium]